jgi:hypothetical protein
METGNNAKRHASRNDADTIKIQSEYIPIPESAAFDGLMTNAFIQILIAP